MPAVPPACCSWLRYSQLTGILAYINHTWHDFPFLAIGLLPMGLPKRIPRLSLKPVSCFPPGRGAPGHLHRCLGYQVRSDTKFTSCSLPLYRNINRSDEVGDRVQTLKCKVHLGCPLLAARLGPLLLCGLASDLRSVCDFANTNVASALPIEPWFWLENVHILSPRIPTLWKQVYRCLQTCGKIQVRQK